MKLYISHTFPASVPDARRAAATLATLAVALVFCASGCTMSGPDGNTNTNTNSNTNGNDNGDDSPQPTWKQAFDTSNVGDLSGVWGSGPDDVFVVGGTPDRGEVYHFDGSSWASMTVPQVPLLVWVFGFGPDDVFAVGEEGAVLHYDGSEWRILVTGVAQALWGVWGSSPQEVWMVGGDVGAGDPVIIRFDGAVFESIEIPENDRNATALFKVWGVDDQVFAVGENGLILEYANGEWAQVLAGAAADDDFVSLWGTVTDNIVVVGGRGSARISVYDGGAFDTSLFSGVPGLNAVFTLSTGESVVGGQNGYVALFDPATGELTEESSGTTTAIHAAWGDGAGHVFAVGGRFSPPHSGVALVRSIDDSGSDDPPACQVDADCSGDLICVAGVCEVASDDDVQIELGFLDLGVFRVVDDGGDMPLFFGFQGGGSHIFATLEVTGLSADADVDISWRAVREDDGQLLSDADGFGAVLNATGNLDALLIEDQFVLFGELASVLDNERVELTFSLADGTTGDEVATLTRVVVLRLN